MEMMIVMLFAFLLVAALVAGGALMALREAQLAAVFYEDVPAERGR